MVPLYGLLLYIYKQIMVLNPANSCFWTLLTVFCDQTQLQAKARSQYDDLTNEKFKKS